MIRTLLISSMFAIATNSVYAQMGGGGGGGMGPAQLPTPEVDGETWIWQTPDKWYPYSKTSDLKNDVYIFPTGQKPEKWKQMLQFEQFTSTLGLVQAKQVFEVKTQNLENCTFDTIKDQPEKGYSMIQWSERCATDEGTAVTLRKATIGNERLYMASKTWKSEPKESEMQKWLNYLGETYVCDGTQEHDCLRPRPEGGPRGPR